MLRSGRTSEVGVPVRVGEGWGRVYADIDEILLLIPALFLTVR
jgi:hypothetical protein